jgi:hypothetical protein
MWLWYNRRTILFIKVSELVLFWWKLLTIKTAVLTDEFKINQDIVCDAVLKWAKAWYKWPILSSLLKTDDFKTDIGLLPYELGINPGLDHDICLCLIGVLIYMSKIVHITG